MNFPPKTKIVCTIGPSSNYSEILVKLINEGMDIARINFSHGNYESHKKAINSIRLAEEETDSRIAILADLQGPKIRTGKVENDGVILEDGKNFIISSDSEFIGNSSMVGTTFPELIQDTKKGDTILLDDGYIILKVEDVSKTEISSKIIKGGLLKNNKGIIVPGTSSSAKSLSEKDIEDLKFALSEGCDAVAMSFVRNERDIIELRSAMKIFGRIVPIVAKIEREEAVNNIDSIIKETDIIMVARGDLGLEMPAQKVPIVQKEIIDRCNFFGKPVIVATQMLESMISNPRPTRAEASDVANAVLDGTDAVMLSGETSVGKYPLEAVHYMDSIIHEVEKKYFTSDKFQKVNQEKLNDFSDALANAACVLAAQTGATAIISITGSGYTSRNISKYRPKTPILALTDNVSTQRALSFVWGVNAIKVPQIDNRTDLYEHIGEYIRDLDYVNQGDTVVFAAGLSSDEIMPQNVLKLFKIN